MSRFRIFGLPLVWAVLLGVVVFILWKPIVALFKGFADKFKKKQEATASAVPPAVENTDIDNSQN